VEEIDDEVEYQKAFALAERKFRSISHLESEKIYQRIYSLLARKGYGHGITSQIMRELIAH
jgi:regulatory protein